MKKLIPVIGDGPKGAFESHFSLWREIDELDRANSLGFVKLEGNLLLSISALYFEWYLRSKVDNALQLPGVLRDCPAVQIIHEKRPLLERLQTFANLIVQQVDYKRDLENMAKATICAPVSLRQHDVLEYLATHTVKNIGKDVAQVEVDRLPSLSSPVRGATKSVSSSLNVSVGRGASDVDLRRKATDELARLREKEPKRYQFLKQSYLDTLELERKQIILEMKEKMQPSAFDDHLRYSLVKFMIENPSAWTSEDHQLSRFL